MVFKIIGQKSRNYLFVISLVLAVFLLAWVAPIVFDFQESFDIGYFRTDRDYRTTYSDGYGELNMDLTLDRIRDDRYDYYISCRFSSGGSVEIVGLSFINYSVTLTGSNLMSQILTIDPPTGQFSRGSTARIDAEESMIWRGTIEAKFISNSIVQNETIQFALTVQMSWNDEDYYNMGLISYVVLFLWFMAFPLGPFILKGIIQPNFRAPLDEEAREAHKRYLDFFKKTKDEEGSKNSE